MFGDYLNLAREYITDRVIISLLVILLYTIFEVVFHPVGRLIVSFNVEPGIVELGVTADTSLHDITFYTCSALIQAYAALVAILYSLISIHLQTRYGHAVVHALIKNLVKPLIVLTLFTLTSITVMIVNSSDALLVPVKYIFLILEVAAFIISLAFLYTHIISTVKLRPSRIVFKLLNPRSISNLLEKATITTKDGREALAELWERILGSFTILRILLEDQSNIDEAEATMNAMAYSLQEIKWRNYKTYYQCIVVLDYVVEKLSKRIIPILHQIVPSYRELSSTGIANLLGVIAQAYVRIGGGRNMNLYVKIVEETTYIFLYRSSLASVSTIYPGEIKSIYERIFAHIMLGLNKRKTAPDQIIVKELIVPLYKSVQNIFEHTRRKIKSLPKPDKQKEMYKQLEDVVSTVENLMSILKKRVPELETILNGQDRNNISANT